jgi:SAM-dependent methyltransferase
MTTVRGDVFGLELTDLLAGRRAFDVVERDDGYLMAFDARYLIAPFKQWDDPVERRAMRFVRGRVLDVGCGGGRVCLHLQERQLEVGSGRSMDDDADTRPRRQQRLDPLPQPIRNPCFESPASSPTSTSTPRSMWRCRRSMVGTRQLG